MNILFLVLSGYEENAAYYFQLSQPSSGVTYKDGVFGLDIGFVGQLHRSHFSIIVYSGALTNSQLQSTAPPVGSMTRF
jgi:hypothetical protein